MRPEQIGKVMREAETEIMQLGTILRQHVDRVHRGREYPIYAALLEAGWKPPGGADDTPIEGPLSRED